MRRSIEILDRQFSQLHQRSVDLVASVPPDELYRRTAADGDLMMKLTVGENIIRSAAFVELTFGGITTRLWDDYSVQIGVPSASLQHLGQYQGAGAVTFFRLRL